MPQGLTARLYISRHCLLCRVVEPWARWWFFRRGLALEVYKVFPDGQATQVNGHETRSARHLPGVPALEVGRVTVIGLGILKQLRQTEKGR